MRIRVDLRCVGNYQSAEIRDKYINLQIYLSLSLSFSLRL